jgi:hypothetical protein
MRVSRLDGRLENFSTTVHGLPWLRQQHSGLSGSAIKLVGAIAGQASQSGQLIEVRNLIPPLILGMVQGSIGLFDELLSQFFIIAHRCFTNG